VGVNYYYREGVCPSCGHYEDALHIGKKSVGWCFVFRGYSGKRSMIDWLQFLKKGRGHIYGDYNRKVSLKDFMEMVVASQKEKHPSEAGYREDEFGYVFIDRDFC